MKVQIEEITSVKKSLTIEIPQEVITHEFDHLYSELNKKVTVPGFRPGRTPLAVLEKKYGASVEEEVIRNLVPDYYQKAVAEVGIFPVAYPAFEKIGVKKDAPLLFTATVEVKPNIPPLNYTGLSAPRREITVTDAEVEESLRRIQEQEGRLASYPDDHSVLESDFVIIDYEGLVNGKKIKKTDPSVHTVQVGSKTSLPEIDAILLGAKKGDQVEVDLPLPSEHPDKEIAGKTVHLKVALKEIKKKIIPNLDDELAKDIGLASLEALREKVKQSLLAIKTGQQEHEQKNILMKQLIALHPFDVPPSMVEVELHAMIERLKETLPKEPDMEALHKQYGPLAEERTKGIFILESIAKEEKLEMTDQELENEINRIAEKAKVSPAEAKQAIFRHDGSLEQFKSRIELGKAFNRVYDLAKFEDQGESS